MQATRARALFSISQLRTVFDSRELIWGEGATARQTIASISLTGAYKKFLLEFTAQAGTNDAILEITGTGNGDFHIGAVSLMPAR